MAEARQELRDGQPARAVAILAEQERRNRRQEGLAELMFEAYRKLEPPGWDTQTARWARQVHDPQVRKEAQAYLKRVKNPGPPPPPFPPRYNGPDEF